ncbi:MAG: hypothetical protein AAF467_21710 [Actinomycetota bacterium]
MSEVEIIEGDRLVTPSLAESEPETVTDTSVRSGGVIGPRMIGVASAAVFLLALSILTRPGSEVPEVPVQTTAVPEQTTTSFLPGVDDAGSVQTLPSTVPVTQPIPLFEETSLPEIPGVIAGIGPDGGLVTIDRSTVRPTQDDAPSWLAPTDDPATELFLADGTSLALGDEVWIEQTAIVGNEESIEIESLFGAETGLILVVSRSLREQRAALYPFGPEVSAEPEPVQEWAVDTQSLKVWGWWRDRLVVTQAGQGWLMAANDSEHQSLNPGVPIAFNGDVVVQLRCDQPGECVIATQELADGTTTEVPVPETLAALAHDDWVPTAALSPNDRYIGGSARFGALSLPYVVDLVTGESFGLADGMNQEAPVSWSPDSQWLSYVYTDDVMVWSLEAGRSWRVQLNRPLATLTWH